MNAKYNKYIMIAKYRIFVVALMLFIATGCEDRLEISPISNVGGDNFYLTESDIQQAVVAGYDAIQAYGQYNYVFMLLMEIRADDAAPEDPSHNSSAQGDIDLFRMTPSNSRINSAWNNCYRGIQRCNIVLNRIDDVDFDSTTKNALSGEVKFLRALTYFNMVRLWGDVPLVINEVSDPFESFSIGRTSVTEVYTQIIADLTQAVDQLPQTNEAGRATTDVAKTLLGKVYLTLGNWSDANLILSNVSGYSLQPNFADNFGISNENGIESIFEVQYQAGNGEGSRYPNEVAPFGSESELLNGIGSQRGENIPSLDLLNSFETGDLRKNVSIGILADGITRYAKKLIAIPSADYDSDLNFIVLRYADVLLMRAEALNELGYNTNGEAFDLLNQIRNRAGLASLTDDDLPNQSSFRDAILEERRHEFVSENHRWFDLVRTGRAVEVMNASTSVPRIVSDFQLIYPIPLSAINTVNDLDILPQNPGY